MTKQGMIEIIDREITMQNRLASAEDRVYGNAQLAREHRSIRDGLTLAKIRLRDKWEQPEGV